MIFVASGVGAFHTVRSLHRGVSRARSFSVEPFGPRCKPSMVSFYIKTIFGSYWISSNCFIDLVFWGLNRLLLLYTIASRYYYFFCYVRNTKLETLNKHKNKNNNWAITP